MVLSWLWCTLVLKTLQRLFLKNLKQCHAQGRRICWKVDGVCSLSAVKKIFSVWKVHLKHHLSPAYLYCWGKEGWWAWIHVHPYCLRLAAPQQPEGSWRNPKQSWEEGKHVSGVDSWVQCSAGFPASKLEGARAQGWALPCDCPCSWVVSRLPGLDQALPAGVFPSSAPGTV